MPTLLLMLMAASLPQGRYALSPVATPNPSETPELSAKVELDHAKLRAPFLVLDVRLNYAGLTPDANQLNQFAFDGPFVRLDEGDWVRCQRHTPRVEYYSDDEAKKSVHVKLKCGISTNDFQRLDLRFMTTKLGAELDMQRQFEGISSIQDKP